MNTFSNRISAIVMLSGFSSRYPSCNKLLIPFGDKRLCEHILEIVKALPFFEIIITYQDNTIKNILEEFQNVFFNEYAHEGISSSIKLGLQHSSPNTDGYLFLSGDRPFLTTEHIIHIVESFQSQKIIIPFFNNQRSSPCLFSNSFKNQLLSLNAHEVGNNIINKHPDNCIRVDFTGNGGLDINTEEDYQRALKIYKETSNDTIN